MDGIERHLDDQARVLRLSIMDSVGRQLAVRYGVRRVPMLVLLDGSGGVVLMQTGTPRREEIVSTVKQLTE